MGENPPLSEQEIASIKMQQKLRQESGVKLDDLIIAVEYLGT